MAPVRPDLAKAKPPPHGGMGQRPLATSNPVGASGGMGAGLYIQRCGGKDVPSTNGLAAVPGLPQASVSSKAHGPAHRSGPVQ